MSSTFGMIDRGETVQLEMISILIKSLLSFAAFMLCYTQDDANAEGKLITQFLFSLRPMNFPFRSNLNLSFFYGKTLRVCARHDDISVKCIVNWSKQTVAFDFVFFSCF